MSIERLWILIICLGGCASTHKKPNNFDDNPQKIVEQSNDCQQNMASISGVLDVTIWREGERLRVEQLFIRSASGNLRIDTLSPIGEPLSTIVFDGGKLSILDQNANIFMVGEATRDVVKEFLFIDLTPQDLSSLLGGCIPLVKGTYSPSQWDKESGRSWFMINAESWSQSVWFESNFDVRRLDYTSANFDYTLLMGDYRNLNKVRRPYRFQFNEQSEAVEIRFVFSELKTLEKIPEQAFILTPPQGFSVRAL